MRANVQAIDRLRYKFFRDDIILQGITDKYQEEYPDLKRDKIYALVVEVSDVVISTLDNAESRHSQSNMKKCAYMLKNIVTEDLSARKLRHLPGALSMVYQYARGNDRYIADCFEMNKLSQCPPQLYQDFTKELVQDRVEVITNTLLNNFLSNDGIHAKMTNFFSTIVTKDNKKKSSIHFADKEDIFLVESFKSEIETSQKQEIFSNNKVILLNR